MHNDTRRKALQMRVGAVLFPTGLMVYLAATQLHPASEPPGESARAFLEYSGAHGWALTHAGQFLGLFLALLGFVGLAERLKDDSPASDVLARLGVVAAVVTLAVAAVLQAVDGVALKFAVDRWATAPEGQSETAFRVAEAVRWIEVGVNSYMRILTGITLALFGAALSLSSLLPHRLGWVGMALGASEMVQGVHVAQHGFDPLAMTLLMITTVAYLAWFCVLAWVMWRQAGVPAVVSDKSAQATSTI